MTIDELKALMPLVREFEATENRLAQMREYKGDLLVLPTDRPPQPHGGYRDDSHLRFHNEEIIDTVIEILDGRLERLRAALNAAMVE
jgi:hypothetical protein